MFETLRRAGLAGPALMTAAALMVLMGLGFWQLERKAWKEQVIAGIEAGLAEPAAPLEDPKAAWSALGRMEYRPVTVSGRFLNGEERYVFSTEDGTPGWLVFTPLETENGNVVFVNRGFVPNELKDPAKRAQGLLEGMHKVEGLVRHAGVKGRFEPENDPARNVWYWRDLAGLAQSVRPAIGEKFVMPFFIDARAEPANPGGWPKGGVTHLNIPNRHLEYVLTWFGLAGALAVVFAVYARDRIRAGGKPG